MQRVLVELTEVRHVQRRVRAHIRQRDARPPAGHATIPVVHGRERMRPGDRHRLRWLHPELAHMLEQLDGIRTLLVDRLRADELPQRAEQLGADALGLGIGEQGRVRPFRKEALLGEADQQVVVIGVDDALTVGVTQRLADVHHRVTERAELPLRIRVHDGDLVVVGELTGRVGLEDPAESPSAERGRLGHPQGAHAARSVDGDAPLERVEDLLVPDRQGLGEDSVDEQDRLG